MRVPTTLLRCKIAGGVSVILMTAGTIFDMPEVRAWSVLVAVLAAACGIGAAVRNGTEAMKAYVHRWSLETFEHGFKQGVEQGRAMEAAQRLIESSRNIS